MEAYQEITNITILIFWHCEIFEIKIWLISWLNLVSTVTMVILLANKEDFLSIFSQCFVSAKFHFTLNINYLLTNFWHLQLNFQHHVTFFLKKKNSFTAAILLVNKGEWYLCLILCVQPSKIVFNIFLIFLILNCNDFGKNYAIKKKQVRSSFL